MARGKVFLVGAGPGDIGLLTLKGARCLKQADTVVYDRLLDERVLNLCPPEAEKIFVGKSAGQHALEQGEINQLLVTKALEGKTTVRLKGGDPFVFGRGGEEALFLRQHAIDFEVVPGVSSAIAGPAYAGIPVTHRGLAASFAVITGHQAGESADISIPWQSLAEGIDTLVFLMGLNNLPEIVEKLIQAGKAPETPAAVIQNGTRPEQKNVIAPLADIVRAVAESDLTPPALIVIGATVNLHSELRWFDNRPLAGKRIVITRPLKQSGRLSRLLEERGALAVPVPLISIEEGLTDAIDDAIFSLAQYHWLVFTSRNGVEAFYARLAHFNLDTRALAGLRIAAIGPATAEALKERGLRADLCPERYTGRGLLAAFGNLDINKLRFLLPRADLAGKELAQGLEKQGAVVQEIQAYRTVPRSEIDPYLVELIRTNRVDAILLTSSSTVSGLLAACGGDLSWLARLKIACIGPITARAAEQAGLPVAVTAAQSDINGLVAALENLYSEEKL
jgi:uroporphyrinogen III methyltransferase/synthase